MKLLNHTTLYFTFALFFVLVIWGTIFYFAMLDEAYDSIDDGLDNTKMLIIRRINMDSTFSNRTEFNESNYLIRKAKGPVPLSFSDIYKDTTIFMVNERDQEPMRMLKTFFRQGGDYYELRIFSSFLESDDLMEDLLLYLFLLFLALIISVIVINNFLLQKTWQPFYRLLERVTLYRLDGQEQIKFEKTNIDEFNALNTAVAKLINSNSVVYESQKQFIENASHELQTPAAICLNKLELFVEKHPLTEEQASTLEAVIQQVEKIRGMNKSLLLISKIENHQFSDVESVNFNEIIAQAIENFTDQASFKDITISLKENGQASLRMNRNLAEIMVNNLLKNAIVHNIPHGEVIISVDPESISFENTGKPVRLDREMIFKRFYKNSDGNTSMGLGLSIVKTIADLNNMEVKYTYEDRHRITVWFL